MRAQFELCVKVVGLVLFCSGVLAALMALTMILWLISEPTGGRFYPPELLQNNPFAEKLREYESSSLRTRKWTMLTSLLFATTTVFIGLYLMRSGKLLIRLCYPQENSQAQSCASMSSQGVDMRIRNKESGETEQADARPDGKYAPPGYFERTQADLTASMEQIDHESSRRS